jgi:hypothetical protein
MGCYAVYFGDGGKYIRLFIISFVNNSVAVRHEAWVLISATRVTYKMGEGDEGINCFSNNGFGVALLKADNVNVHVDGNNNLQICYLTLKGESLPRLWAVTNFNIILLLY